MDLKPLNALNVTFLVPFAGSRMVSRTSGPIHILAMEEVQGSRAQCGLRVPPGKDYSRRTRLKAGEEVKVHDACLAPLLAAQKHQQERDFEAAHVQGYHEDIPREFCPLCEAN